ncbi:hypothetical protein SK128_005602, partial [Halocaridina rubra]
MNDTERAKYMNSTCLQGVEVDTSAVVHRCRKLQDHQHITEMPSCPVIEYDSSVFTSTLVSEYHLVCERAYLRPMFVAVSSFGNMLGNILGGIAGD